MKSIRTYFQNQHNEYVTVVAHRFENVELNAERIDKKIDDEREDRLKQSDENLKEIRKQLESTFLQFFLISLIFLIPLSCLVPSGLFSLFDIEKRERIEKEKEILLKIDEEAFVLKEMLDKEKTERILKIKELKNNTDFELKS